MISDSDRELFKAERKSRGITQKAIALEIGQNVNQKDISKFEEGDRVKPERSQAILSHLAGWVSA